MALFRCASGSSGGGATITVTYSSDFYGETVTCSHGTKTYSKVATSSGTLEFSVDEEGTWTISCTIGSDTFTTTADVDLTYDAELVSLPNGETVLPTDDIETWLLCAGIKDKAYTTLAEVLADSETFNALLGDSNACAYMARSTTWASGLIPKMTSNTTPSGECTAISSYTDNPAYKAFDGDASTFWNSTSSSITDVWIGYAFTQKTQISSYKILAGHSSYPATGVSYKLQGSDDAFVSDIHDIDTQSNLDFSDGKPKSFVASGNYRYYRVIYSDMTTSTTYKGITSLIQFYGGTSGDSITESQYAMNLLGQYDTACDALLSDATWASAIANSTYWESVLQPLVPVMTSNTTPSGTASASTGNETAWTAFDRNTSTYWGSTSPTNQRVQYASTTQETFWVVTLKPLYASQTRVKNFKIQGSSDGFVSDIHDLYTGTAPNDSTETVIKCVLNDVATYQYLRALVVDDYGSNVAIKELQFYGRKSSGEKIHGGNPTYDSFYRIVDGNNVPVTDPSLLDAGTYTIYSNGLAKDPDNLSNDYGKTIRICPNTKEIVVRPDNSLYWWGYENPNLEDCTSGNGWSGSYTYVSPTHNQQNITLSSASNQLCGIGTKNLTSASKFYGIATQTSGSNAHVMSSNANPSSKSTMQNLDTSGAFTSSISCQNVSNTVSPTYASVRFAVGAVGTCNAFWYE